MCALLAIVFACQHLESYIYGRDSVNVETDHQPLVLIIGQPLNSAQSCLQWMLLKLTYKNGKGMYLAAQSTLLIWAYHVSAGDSTFDV